MNIENNINTTKNTKKYQPMFEKPVQLPLCPLHNELDQWVLAELHRMIGLVD
ncbi:hypothetical protein KA405_01515 [Patescibacteria group bacterium]|nr:hypothetical protein [Patescibacteria group bacterium]